MKKLNLILLVSLLFTGCGLFELSEVNNNNNNEIVVDDTLESNIINSLKDATREDCITAYTFFSGMSLYIEKSSKLTTTDQVQDLFIKVEDDYKWDREKYPKLTDVIATDMINRGFKTPREINQETKKLLISAFNEYGEACLKAAKEKNQ